MMPYPIYTALLRMALPFALMRLLWRSLKEPGYRRHLHERFGRFRSRRHCAVWVHGVSVGELQAAYPLIDWLRTSGMSLLITTTTPAGRSTAESLYGNDAEIVFLPYDDPAFINRFFSTFRPEIGFILETELWPNLLAHAQARGLPLWLINGRLSERSFNRYRYARTMTKKMLSALAGIAAQTAADAERFRQLGAAGEVFVSGNLKFDRQPNPSLIALGKYWRQRTGKRKTVVFASTRAGEEGRLLPVLDQLRQADILSVIVPRHPNRFNDVFDLLRAHGFQCQRRSDNEPIRPDTQVWLGDSLGEMTAYYALSDVAVIGGSWLPYGGQNPIEALAVETPAVVGPHTFHFSKIIQDGVQAKAIVQVEDIDTLGGFLILLLNSAPYYDAMRQAATGFVRQQRGAIDRLRQVLGPLLKRVGARPLNPSST